MRRAKRALLPSRRFAMVGIEIGIWNGVRFIEHRLWPWQREVCRILNERTDNMVMALPPRHYGKVAALELSRLFGCNPDFVVTEDLREGYATRIK